MQDPELSGLIVEPLAKSINAWLDAGKLDEGDVDRALTPNARSIVDSLVGAGIESTSWIPLEDVEGMVSLIAGQVGGGTGLVEWSAQVVSGWESDVRFVAVVGPARGLIDSSGYIVAQSSELLLRNVDWRFEGGRERFCVRLRGLGGVSSNLKTLLGAMLSRLAERAQGGFDDLRFEGVESSELCIFGVREWTSSVDGSSESRLHRAALIA